MDLLINLADHDPGKKFWNEYIQTVPSECYCSQKLSKIDHKPNTAEWRYPYPHAGFWLIPILAATKPNMTRQNIFTDY
jgi:hypothetical protein